MRAFFVITKLELIKAVLLLFQGERRRRGRVSFERAMHPLVPPILLRLASV